MLSRFTDLYAKEMEIETINFGCNNSEAASKLNTVLNTIGLNFDLLKLIYSEKATKFCKIFTLLLSYLVPVKSKEKISQNFVAFSEYMNFKRSDRNKSFAHRLIFLEDKKLDLNDF